MSQLEELKIFHFNPADLQKRKGGRKYRCNAVINIQIHYNLLFIDPQVLFINCHSILSSRHDAKNHFNCSGFLLAMASSQFTAAEKGLAIFAGIFSF